MPRAGFGIRLAAAAIDAVAFYVLNLLATGFIFPAVAMTQRAGGGPPPAVTRVLTFVVAVTAVLWLGYAAFELFGSASPAKRLLKLRVASAADGGPAALGQRARRWALKYLPVVLYLVMTAVMYAWVGRGSGPPKWVFAAPLLFGVATLVVIGGFFATLGSARRALHDYLGGTMVLKVMPVTQGFAPIMAQPVVPRDPAAPPAAAAAHPAEGPRRMSDTPPAGPGVRLAAALIDAAAVTAILAAATALAVSVPRSTELGEIALFVSAGGAAAAAYLLPEAFYGRTLGKKLLRLRVGGRHGRRAPRPALLARWAVKSTPLFVGTAVVCAELAADQYPLTFLVLPLVQWTERVLERAVGQGWVVRAVAWPPLVYGGGIPFAAVLGAGWFGALGRQRRTLHDRITGTAVYADGPAASRGFEPLPPVKPG